MHHTAAFHQAIVAAIHSMGEEKATRIAEATGLPLQRVDAALRRLVQCTSIRASSPGVLSAPYSALRSYRP